MSKIRYVRHPYLISRAIAGSLEWRLSSSKRIDQYERHVTALENGLQELFDVGPSYVADLTDRFSNNLEFQRKMKEARDFLGKSNAGIEERASLLLYLICRTLRPMKVVETGVASGFSSASMLQALEDNGVGELYSVDLHYRDGVTIPFGKQLGWVIPEHLEHRWHLLLGESVKVIPHVLKEVGPVDLFFHDSRHTYRTMMKEYKMIWPRLVEGGLLLSHDVQLNDAFLDFCDEVGRMPVLTCDIGAVMR